MSRFFVGQRVRLARPLNPANEGHEGRIVFLGPVLHGDVIDGTPMAPLIPCDCAVRWDSSTNPQATAQLEPLTPEGMKPVEWSECLWQPEHLRESAHG